MVGGHCLPVDPYYFSHIAKKNNFKTSVTLAGRDTNEHMKNFIINLIKKKLTKNRINILNDKVIFAGLTYKKNVSDLRNSHALKIFEYFSKIGKKIYGIDPFLSNKNNKKIINLNQFYKDTKIKCIILLVEHDSFKNMIKKVNKKIHVINLFNFYEKS